MLIEIETKPNMSEKALQILEDLKEVLFESVSVKDESFLTKQKELHQKYKNAINKSSKLQEHNEVWNSIEQHCKDIPFLTL